MDVLDIWVNLVTEQSAADFLGHEENAHIPGYLGGDGSAGVGVDALLGVMDELGLATGILCPGLHHGDDESLALAEPVDGRLLVALGVAEPERPTRNVRRIRELASHRK